MTLGLINFRNSRAVLSDDQEGEELRVQRRLTAALSELRSAISDLNHASALVEIEPSALEDFINDECPSAEYWAEKIERARHG